MLKIPCTFEIRFNLQRIDLPTAFQEQFYIGIDISLLDQWTIQHIFIEHLVHGKHGVGYRDHRGEDRDSAPGAAAAKSLR